MDVSPIVDYLNARGIHCGGSMGHSQLDAIARNCRPGGTTIETGCGATTILFSQTSRRHIVFALDDRAVANSSVRFVTECPLYRPDNVEFVFGFTQQTLPAFQFDHAIDLALIDGPHAFPLAEMEYYFIYPHLATGAILVIDDIHIPTIFNMYRFLREEPMFSFVEKAATTALFRRTEAPTFDPLGGGWEFQEFNRRRFPIAGRDERIGRHLPEWLVHLVPVDARERIKAWLVRTS